MKTSNEFIMREIAGEYVLVPIGKRALTVQGLVTMNEVGALIWEMMEKESDIDQIVSGILDEYEVDEQTARKDVLDFIGFLKDCQIIED